MSTNSFLYRQLPSNLSRFGLWTGYFFSINTVIGAGFLALPYSFNRSGWLLSLVIMILMAVQAYYMALELIEMTSRAECIKQLEEVGISVERPSLINLLKGKFNKVHIPEEISPEIVDRRFDVTSLFELVFGHRLGVVYMFFLYLLLTGALVSFASIFASSFAAAVPLGFSGVCNIYEDEEFFGACRVNYWFYLTIYSICMMYLTLKGLREQRWMQAVLTLMRFVIIFLIIVTSLALIITGKDIRSSKDVGFKMPVMFRADKLVASLPSITFAFIYQLQFPSIIEFIKDKEKNLKKIVVLVTVTCLLVYSLLSLIVPIAIHDVDPQCSMNFRSYSAGYSQSQRPAWTYIVAYVVVLFPAFDVFSSFPVVAVSVSDNLQSLKEGVSNEDLMNDGRKKFYRIFAVAVPIIVSFITFNLSEIVDWVGIFGYLLIQIAFPIMHVYFREILQVRSCFDVPFYSKWFCVGLSAVNCLILIAVLIEKIIIQVS